MGNKVFYAHSLKLSDSNDKKRTARHNSIKIMKYFYFPYTNKYSKSINIGKKGDRKYNLVHLFFICLDNKQHYTMRWHKAVRY